MITTLVDWICPRGSQTFFLPVVDNLPGNWVGSVRVESQEWLTPGGPRVTRAEHRGGGDADQVGRRAAQRDGARRWRTTCCRSRRSYDWQIGVRRRRVGQRVGLFAIPPLLADLEGTGVTSELAITNLVPKPGFTDFVIFVYDQNGLLDYVCQKLNEKQVEYIDLRPWGFINPGSRARRSAGVLLGARRVRG